MNLPFYKKQTIPQILIQKIKHNFPNYKIIIATTDSPKDDLLAENLQQPGVVVFRGSEDDVLQRFIDAAIANEVQTAIRVCADNPFIDVDLINDLLNNWGESYDYLTHQINNTPSMKTSFGFFVELVQVGALQKARKLTNDKLYIEHVTNYIYQNPDLFKVNWVEAPVVISENDYLRLTVDTQNDFDLAKGLYEEIHDQQPNFDYKDVIALVRKDVTLHSKMRREKLAKSNIK